MKIIKKSENYSNDKKPSWTTQDTCPDCNAVIEYNDLDIGVRIGNRRFFIQCGNCHNWLELDNNKKLTNKNFNL